MEQSFEEIERIKQGWIEFLGCRGYDVFGTVTFKTPARSGHVALSRAKTILRKFCKAIGVKHVVAFFVAEQHESGTYHAHLLWRSGCSDRDQLVRLLHGLWQFTFDRLGRCSFEMLRDADAVRGYVCKYLVKRPCDWAMVDDQRKMNLKEAGGI